MRFDDMIATVLEQPGDRPDRVAVQWRQLVDLLAQRRGEQSPLSERAFCLLRRFRDRVDARFRQETARSLAGLPVDPDLVAFFAEDRPEIASPVIGAARLRATDWISILPRMGPTARSLLRHRRDLPPEVNKALSAFGASDLVIEGAAGAPPSPVSEPEPDSPEAVGSESQISELVQRIETYRRQREEGQPAPARAPLVTERCTEFRWECGTDGVIRWIEGAPREALVGQSIAVIAALGHYGVDGQAAGAFEKRSPFRDARFKVPGEGGASGDWRISGIPFFDPARGNFLGYRGTARRPRLDETARPEEPAGIFGSQLPPDSLRQLIHELRTPLNAIVGFAELIEGQYMGPAARGYRAQAAEIMEQARRLLSAVDDLDTAARIETSRLQLEESQVDAVALLGRLHESYQKIASQRGALLTLDIAPGLPLARVEAEAAERMFARLLAATIGLAGEGETLETRMDRMSGSARSMLRLTVGRPQAIAGLSESELLDPGYSPEGDWPAAPALGLGFALRLVRNLAQASGGDLEVKADRIRLDLPAGTEAGADQGEGESGA